MDNKQQKHFRNRIKDVIDFHYSGPTKEKKQRVKEITDLIMRTVIASYNEGKKDGMEA